ncbi:tetratricopeptide repeat protein [Sulfurovum sp. bin170]|uniref:tetratricopeptide repeat protein n=1 Tax=Sulfurovum sp. bin170 TaxID=2695268 RepID=UPI0013DE9E3B|nr:tetratricopeptide repeat protein [Sulfurovum sp. bin170]NEW60183.1 tetratricopeptide repeat protein [Sulfurovum sp. bin170]
MSVFQFLLFIISIIVFVLFFKQLFSGAFPKRGVDFEATRDNEQISGMRPMDNSFSMSAPRQSRVDQLVSMADRAIENSDFIEADKALSSALILEKDNLDLLLKHGFVLINLDRLSEAKETYMELLDINSEEDMAHVSLANVLHKLDENELAIEHHKRAIELDSTYAPHYFNYANTLYYTKDSETALINYKKAFEVDSSLEEAERMIKKLS